MKKNKDIKWTDIWRAPFYNDGMGYIWGEGNMMTFTAEESDTLWMKVFLEDMTKVLNGEELVEKYEGLTVVDGCDLCWQNHMIGSFRGWGHLTGGLHMSEEEAAEVQDGLIHFVVDKMTEKLWKEQ